MSEAGDVNQVIANCRRTMKVRVFRVAADVALWLGAVALVSATDAGGFVVLAVLTGLVIETRACVLTISKTIDARERFECVCQLREAFGSISSAIGGAVRG